MAAAFLLLLAAAAAITSPARAAESNATTGGVGGSNVVQGMWDSRTYGGPLAVGQANAAGYIFVTYRPEISSTVDGGKPFALLGAAQSHACGKNGTLTTILQKSFVSLDGSVDGAAYVCETARVSGATWAYAEGDRANGTARAAENCPPARLVDPALVDAVETNTRVAGAALADASAGACAAGGGAVGVVGDTSAPVDVAAFKPLPQPLGARPGQGVYTGGDLANKTSIGMQTRYGFQYAAWSDAKGLRLVSGVYANHTCIKGDELSYQAIGARRDVYLNGTVNSEAFCQTVRFNATSRTLFVLYGTTPGECPPTTFAEADATYTNELYVEEEGLGGGPASPCVPASAARAARAGALAAAAAAALALAALV